MPAPFVFYDLRSREVDATRAFFSELAGFHVEDLGAPLLVDDQHAPWGGLTALAADDERVPMWIPYLGVDDLDTSARRAIELGASMVRARTDLPTGSVVVVADPGGAPFALWQDAA